MCRSAKCELDITQSEGDRWPELLPDIGAPIFGAGGKLDHRSRISTSEHLLYCSLESA